MLLRLVRRRFSIELIAARARALSVAAQIGVSSASRGNNAWSPNNYNEIPSVSASADVLPAGATRTIERGASQQYQDLTFPTATSSTSTTYLKRN